LAHVSAEAPVRQGRGWGGRRGEEAGQDHVAGTRGSEAVLVREGFIASRNAMISSNYYYYIFRKIAWIILAVVLRMRE
jgi:hypothetical protein